MFKKYVNHCEFEKLPANKELMLHKFCQKLTVRKCICKRPEYFVSKIIN